VKNSSTALIEVLLKTIDKVGIKKTIEVLEISQNSTNDILVLQGLIILNTCQSFGITEHMLLKGRKNIANRTNAIGVCAVLLKKMCRYSQIEISMILKKEPSNINKYLKKFENLDNTFKSDINIMHHIDKIENETMRYYEVNKTQQNGE
tara:strand:- start:9022 stop:9468 length:447 start_codon:yes stop_codon:yes gene_type:complete